MSVPQFLHPVCWTNSGQWYSQDGLDVAKLQADVRGALDLLGGTARAVIVDMEFEPAGRPELHATVNSPEGLLRIPFNAISEAVAAVTDLPIGWYDFFTWSGGSDAVAKFQQSYKLLAADGVLQEMRLFPIDAYMTGDAAADATRWDLREQFVMFANRLKKRKGDAVCLVHTNRRLIPGAAPIDLGHPWDAQEMRALVQRGMLLTPFRTTWWPDWQLTKRAIVKQRSLTTGEATEIADQAMQNLLESEGGWVNVPIRGANYDSFLETLRRAA